MSASWQRWVALGGRVLLSVIFLMSAFGKVTNWSGTEAYMASHGMPAVPVLLALAVLFEAGGGLCLLLGCRTRLAALALVVFLIPATLIFHNFWAFEGAEQQMQMINFLKNLAIMGGLLHVVGTGPAGLAIDSARSRSAKTA
jgi:putative oxidoreductase